MSIIGHVGIVCPPHFGSLNKPHLQSALCPTCPELNGVLLKVGEILAVPACCNIAGLNSCTLRLPASFPCIVDLVEHR